MAPGLVSQQQPTQANGPVANKEDVVTAAVASGSSTPSEIVADAGIPVGALNTNTTTTMLLSERVERARDTLVESQLYGRLMEVGEALRERTTSVWSLSKGTAWVLGTSFLVLVLPVLWEIDREASTQEAAAAISAAADTATTSTTTTAAPDAASASTTTTTTAAAS